MTCAQNDIIIQKFQSEIEHKKKELLKKRSYLQNLVSGNEFLDEVIDDYDKFYNIIIKQKQEQHTSLANISEYIDKIALNTNITNSILNDSKYDQRIILNQMNIINKELDTLSNI
tara:strand:- start:322 stop:666 length:345 start_codon:yes stop_codon:yes gene_type:complete